jgi:glycosyltransferase involved in cell wall biosynthesis
MPLSFSAIICTGGPEGPESVQNWALAGELAARGHRVALVCDRRRHDLVGSRDGFDVSTWPSRLPGRPKDFRFFRRLVRQVAPDVVIGNFQSVNVAIPVGWAMGVPCRIAWHRSLSSQTPYDFPRPRVVQWVHDRLKGWVLACATHVVPVSPAGQRDAIATYGVPADRCGTYFHTCRPDPCRLLDAPAAPDDDCRRVAYLGRVVPSKGIDVLLRALGRIRDREPGWRIGLDVVGDGFVRGSLTDLARDLGIERLVKWHGKLDQQHAFRVLARAHVMALPIRSDPGPGVVPEGLGLGLPVVVSRVGGMADLLADVAGAVLFTVDDDRELADHLHAILADPGHRQSLSAAARRAYLERFRLEDWVERVAGWLESTVTP